MVSLARQLWLRRECSMGKQKYRDDQGRRLVYKLIQELQEEGEREERESEVDRGPGHRGDTGCVACLNRRLVAQSALDRGKGPLSFSGVWTAMVILRPR